eukprot:GHVS01107121.1.p1 GENE.GHVS01107121.1~~GHVS01107121.1.p1  ORF type:complete len:241 (+),score=33.40 GHVS01107121.1:74-796(+)
MAILPILKHAASVEVGGRSVSIMTAVVSPVRPSPPPESVTTSCYNLDNRGGRVWMFVSLLLLGQITMPLNAQPTKLTQFISSHFDNSAASSSPLSSSTPGYYHSSSTRSLLPVPYTNETQTIWLAYNARIVANIAAVSVAVAAFFIGRALGARKGNKGGCTLVSAIISMVFWFQAIYNACISDAPLDDDYLRGIITAAFVTTSSFFGSVMGAGVKSLKRQAKIGQEPTYVANAQKLMGND